MATFYPQFLTVSDVTRVKPQGAACNTCILKTFCVWLSNFTSQNDLKLKIIYPEDIRSDFSVFSVCKLQVRDNKLSQIGTCNGVKIFYELLSQTLEYFKRLNFKQNKHLQQIHGLSVHCWLSKESCADENIPANELQCKIKWGLKHVTWISTYPPYA